METTATEETSEPMVAVPVATEESVQGLVNSGKKSNEEETVKEMLVCGVQYGRAKRFTHPRNRDFLLKTNKNIEVFDIKKILAGLYQVTEFIKEELAGNKKILFVGTQPAAAEAIEKIATTFNQPFMVSKWVGGFLTNFQTIRLRMRFYQELKEKQESGEINSYPGPEKQRALRELQKMDNLYRGVVKLETLPDAIFSVNLNYKPHRTMVREAKRKGIPIIGICGSDNDPDLFALFIPANDKAPRSINWLIDYLITASKPIEVTEPELTESNQAPSGAD